MALDQNNYGAHHLYAPALLHEGQTYSALSLSAIPPDVQCSGCLEIKAKCSNVSGCHRQGHEALEGTQHIFQLVLASIYQDVGFVNSTTVSTSSSYVGIPQ